MDCSKVQVSFLGIQRTDLTQPGSTLHAEVTTSPGSAAVKDAPCGAEAEESRCCVMLGAINILICVGMLVYKAIGLPSQPDLPTMSSNVRQTPTDDRTKICTKYTEIETIVIMWFSATRRFRLKKDF